MSYMIIKCFDVNKYIIKKHNDILSQKGLEDVIHGGLKCGWRITEAKGHFRNLWPFLLHFLLTRPSPQTEVCSPVLLGRVPITVQV